MEYYPVFLDLKGRHAVVVGGGTQAERKVAGLLGAGALVTVISPQVTEIIKDFIDNKTVVHLEREYRKGDLEGAVLAVAATGSRETGKAVAEEARDRNIPLLVVDAPALSTFIAPSFLERGPVVVAVSTSGRCPGLARRIRLELEDVIGPEYGAIAEVLGVVRRGLLKGDIKGDTKGTVEALLDSPLAELIKDGKTDEAAALLGEVTESDGRRIFLAMPA